MCLVRVVGGVICSSCTILRSDLPTLTVEDLITPQHSQLVKKSAVAEYDRTKADRRIGWVYFLNLALDIVASVTAA